MKTFSVILMVGALAGIAAFANSSVEKKGKVAAKVATAIAAAGVPTSDGGEDGAVYHVWSLECQFKKAETAIVDPSCHLFLGPSEKAPEYSVKSKKASALIKALQAADAAVVFDDESKQFEISLTNVDATTSVHGTAAYSLTFVDMKQ